MPTSISNSGSVPTFIAIGVMKCGTTSLHHYLGKHPKVCVSNPKETDFFLEGNEKSEDWYRGCFVGDAKEYGEVSPNYTKHPGTTPQPGFPGVPGRMHEMLPGVKLIYLVRDPIERAISHYVHSWVKRRVNKSINRAFQPVEESWYLNVSRYHFQLTKYLDHYSMADILVIQSERLRSRSGEVMEEVFRFIGVEPQIAHKREKLTTEHHVSSTKSRKSTAAVLLTETAIGRKITEVGKGLAPEKIIGWIHDALQTDVEKPAPAGDVRSRAEDYLREDVNKLRTLTGKEFRGWSV